MRASKKIQNPKSKIQNPDVGEIHISGAEGLYPFSSISRIVQDYFLRAMEHPRGKPDKVVITLEKIEQRPITVPLLPVAGAQCNSLPEARDTICRLLSDAGVSKKALLAGIRVVTAKSVMRGAALIARESAIRLEPDTKRGVRVSRLGMAKDFEETLRRRLARRGINNSVVKEAIVLASKVASCRDIIAELCISDDPDYTTGYVASKKIGYVRIPFVKEKGNPCGGRVFFVREGAEVEPIIRYLEKRPVIVGT